MSFIKKILVFLLLFITFGCSSFNTTKTTYISEKTVSIQTPSYRYNLIFKENLKRKFNYKKNLKPKFILKANISYNFNETLSVSGLTALNSTNAVVKYSIIDTNSNISIRSGSINSFPVVSSLSNSLYSNEKSLEHIKNRLSVNSANKLYILTKIILRKLD